MAKKRQDSVETGQVGPLVKSAVRVLDIAEYLAKTQEGGTLTGLARDLGIPLSSCHALLQTMVARGYLLKDPDRGVFQLSSKWVRLALADRDAKELIAQADPVMETIYRLCGESESLAVLDDSDVVVLHNRVTKRPVRIVNTIGARMPAHATAMGKAIMASWTREELDAWLANRTLPRYTPNTITSADRLRAELKMIRRRGVAYAKEEYDEGVTAVGACITDGSNCAVGALSILVPKHREADRKYWGILSRLTRAGAGIISRRLGSDAIEGSTSLEPLHHIWNGDVGTGVVFEGGSGERSTG